jgi:hypothetical protein
VQKAFEVRLKEIETEVERLVKNPNLSDKQCAHMSRLVDEGLELRERLQNRQKAAHMASYAAPDEWGMAGSNPGQSSYPFISQAASRSVIDDPMEQKAAEHGLAARKHIGPSMHMISDKQLRDIYAAGRSNMSFGTTIGKGADRNMGLIDKTVSEGSVGSLLPPILLPNAFPLRLEPVRIAEYFPAINAEGQAITFLQHQGNTLAASGAGMSVAENATKPTLGMSLDAVTVPFTVVAAVETISKQRPPGFIAKRIESNSVTSFWHITYTRIALKNNSFGG